MGVVDWVVGRGRGMPSGTTVKVEDVVDNNFTEFDQILAVSTSALAKKFLPRREKNFLFSIYSLKVNVL